MNTLSVQNMKRGFTIVELLVVIVIIGILAALSVVAYNGIQQRARDTAVVSDADGVSGEVTRYSTKNNGVYGSAVVWYSASGTNNTLNFTPTQGNVIDVVANNTGYCVRVYNAGASEHKTLSTAFKKGSTETSCNTLQPSSLARADNPAVIVATTFAGSISGNQEGLGSDAQFNFVNSLTTDSSGNIYATDESNHNIRKITPDGYASILAGSSQGFLNGNTSSARFSSPHGATVAQDGTVLVADTVNHKIRAISTSGVVSTFAGSTAGSNDAASLSLARFNLPNDIAADPSTPGVYYVVDQGSHRIRRIASNTVSTFAGSVSGFADSSFGTNAQFNNPSSVAVLPDGTLYVADSGNYKVRKISPSGAVSTLAGSTSGYQDGTGTSARLGYIADIAVDGDGNAYITDSNRVRKITPEGVVTTLAGTADAGYQDGRGGENIRFDLLYAIAVNPSGDIYVYEVGNRLIRKLSFE